MSTIPEQIKDSTLKHEETLNKIGFSIHSIRVDEDERTLYFDIDLYSVIIHNIRVTKEGDFYKIELPIGIHSPWSTPIPVITFYNNDIWCAIGYSIRGKIRETPWIISYFSEHD